MIKFEMIDRKAKWNVDLAPKTSVYSWLLEPGTNSGDLRRGRSKIFGREYGRLLVAHQWNRVQLIRFFVFGCVRCF